MASDDQSLIIMCLIYCSFKSTKLQSHWKQARRRRIGKALRILRVESYVGCSEGGPKKWRCSSRCTLWAASLPLPAFALKPLFTTETMALVETTEERDFIGTSEMAREGNANFVCEKNDTKPGKSKESKIWFSGLRHSNRNSDWTWNIRQS